MITHLVPDQVPANLRLGYTGKQFKAVPTEAIEVPMTAGRWDGGSVDNYHVLNLSTGEAFPVVASHSDARVPIPSGFAIVKHTIFQGKDLGLTYYVHPDNIAALLPPPTAELSKHEYAVLKATRSFKSSYMGKDRRQMWNEDYESQIYGKLDKETWENTKSALIVKGYLNKAGAITVAGRNALEGHKK